MHILEEFLLVLGLSMDGFAASVCMGMAAGGRRIGPIVAIMSGFHVGMLLLGYAIGVGLPDALAAMYPWAAGLLLAGMGTKMLMEARKPEEEPRAGQSAASIAALSLATSIDAMTVGVTFAVMAVPALRAGAMVAAVMGSLSTLGAALGGRVGRSRRRAARTAGGAILCLLGLKLLLGALGVIGF